MLSQVNVAHAINGQIQQKSTNCSFAQYSMDPNDEVVPYWNGLRVSDQGLFGIQARARKPD